MTHAPPVSAVPVPRRSAGLHHFGEQRALETEHTLGKQHFAQHNKVCDSDWANVGLMMIG